MPDALSKTIPIWCAVMNRLLFREMHESHKLVTPKEIVGASEHAQIEALLDGFVNNVKVMRIQHPSCEILRLTKQDLGLDLCSLRSVLRKPLRPSWLTHGLTSSIEFIPSTDYNTIICYTASRRVVGAEMTEDGYIQGAGDDSEGWSKGLTPPLFWKHNEKLLAAVEEDITDLIRDLVATGQDHNATGIDAVKIGPTRLYIGTMSSAAQSDHYDGIIICGGTALSEAKLETNDGGAKRTLNLLCGDGKLGSRALRSQLTRVPPFIASLPDCGSTPKILFACSTGKDLSVGTLLAVLCLFFDDNCELRRRLSLQLSRA